MFGLTTTKKLNAQKTRYRELLTDYLFLEAELKRINTHGKSHKCAYEINLPIVIGVQNFLSEYEKQLRESPKSRPFLSSVIDTLKYYIKTEELKQ